MYYRHYNYPDGGSCKGGGNRGGGGGGGDEHDDTSNMMDWGIRRKEKTALRRRTIASVSVLWSFYIINTHSILRVLFFLCVLRSFIILVIIIMFLNQFVVLVKLITLKVRSLYTRT